MYVSPLTGKAHYKDTDEEREERKTIPATCSWCGSPIEAWFAGISRPGGEPFYRGFCEHCGGERRART